jgi:hypothetical protein
MVENFFKLEDKTVRLFSQYPKQGRENSFPFYSSDTYYFLCDSALEAESEFQDKKKFEHGQKLYINGNLRIQEWNQLLNMFKDTQPHLDVILIGDTDVAPDENILRELKRYCERLYSVNLRQDLADEISPIPLGLESQRYRSAGQLRDFRKKVDFDVDKREIGVLVAWNDATNYSERRGARVILSPLTITREIKDRVTARYIHHLMRKSMFVACPRGNGLDTHRFWESLYLGAIPIVVKKDAIPAFQFGPHLAIKDWQELEKMSLQDLRRIYVAMQWKLKDFGTDSLSNLTAIFGRQK